jgi:hypothetical protein
MILASVINDITLIFGFFAAISETVFNFILPAVFYIQSCRVAGKTHHPFWLGVSILYLIVGTAIFIVSNYENIRKII